MSELTTCNYCTLRQLKEEARKSGAKITVRTIPSGQPLAGWKEVFRDGKSTSHKMMEISDHCVC